MTMDKVSPQIRILAVVLVLVGAAGMLAMRMLGPSVPVEEAAIPSAVRTAPPPTAPKPDKAATAAKPAKPNAPAAKPAKPKPPAVKAPAAKVPKPALPASGFPLAVDAALRKHRVLVVSLVIPGARVDQLGAAEAQAGAKLGGAGYLALNVLNEGVARALLTKLDGVDNPSVLVLKRSGEVAFALSGFADRDTVAQAAANAFA